MVVVVAVVWWWAPVAGSGWHGGERPQRRLWHVLLCVLAAQVYGFTCTCPRCLLESSPEWQQAQAAAGGGSSSGDWETDEEDTSGDAHMAVDEQQQQGQPQQQQAQQEALEPSYLSLFLLKYVCPVRGCYGTMAALPSDPNVCECSVCGATRSDAAFLAELEAAEQQD